MKHRVLVKKATVETQEMSAVSLILIYKHDLKIVLQHLMIVLQLESTLVLEEVD